MHIVGVLLGFLFTIFFHELLHFLIFKLQKVNVIVFNVSLITLLRKKIVVSFSAGLLFGGFNIIDPTEFTNSIKFIELKKKIYQNNLITNAVGFLFLLFSLYISYYLYGNNTNYLFTFFVSCSVVSFLVFYNALFFILGDIKFAFEIKKTPLALCSYLASAELLVGFKNKYLYETTLSYMQEVVVKKDDYFSMICANYIMDYCLYHGIQMEYEFDSPTIYLEYKYLLLKICNSDSLNQDILARFCNNRIGKKVVLQIENNSGFNLRLSSKYSIFKYDVEYKKYIEIIKMKLTERKEVFQNAKVT